MAHRPNTLRGGAPVTDTRLVFPYRSMPARTYGAEDEASNNRTQSLAPELFFAGGVN